MCETAGGGWIDRRKDEDTCWEAAPVAQGPEGAGAGEDRQPFSDFSIRITVELVKHADPWAYPKGSDSAGLWASRNL